jgi:hypothetical protein
MTRFRAMLVIGGLLTMVSGTLSAQAMKVTCKDGTRSAGGQGACSSHGGIAVKATTKADAKVAKTMAKADTKIAKTEMKADAKALKAEVKDEARNAKGATAICNDKTYSHATNRQGMCSSHGGVSKVLKGK